MNDEPTDAPAQPATPPSFEEVVVKSAMPVIQQAVANTVQSVIDNATADVSEKIDANHAASLASIKSVDISSAERDDSLAGRISTLEGEVFTAAANSLKDPWMWRLALVLVGALLLEWAGFLFAGAPWARNLWEVGVAAVAGGGGILAKVSRGPAIAATPPAAS